MTAHASIEPAVTPASPQAPVAVADVQAIRGHFPALERRHGGEPVAYFDGPGGTQVPRAVADAMRDYLFLHNANTHWNYPSSAETDAAIDAARQSVADFLGARPEEIAFGNNMTTLTFHLSRALGRGWGPGDEIVVTDLDHHANIAPWRALERERGVTVVSVPFQVDTGELDWAALEGAMSRRTRLLAIGAASNALGTITDVRAAVRLAHDAGALAFVDAVHLAAHAAIDVGTMECDFLACSSYKFYGPHAGVLFGRSERLAALDVPKLEPAPDAIPERFETGTQNHEGIVGTAAAVDFLASLSTGTRRRDLLVNTMGALHARGDTLVRRLWAGLQEIPGVRCFGPAPGRPRTPTVAFTVDRVGADAVAGALAARGIFVSHGDFYASTVIERLGVGPDGVVRAGCACYTTIDEIERLVEGVREIARGAT
ncbi:MAG TPA: cysteine desulfurase-like protein [Gemmatimonadaceae bacterium]|nr:cysteine desulfurase-like protein [Gemmatimonadaceae bacterium]